MRLFPTFIALTILEAIKSRFFMLFIVLFMSAVLLSGLLGELSLTDTENTQRGVIAAFMRISVILSLALFCISSMARESSDNTLQLFMSLPISRGWYILAKYCGFLVLTACTVGGTGILLSILTPNPAVLPWTVSLFFEATITLAFALFCINSLQHIPLTFMIVMGFYALCRALNGLMLITTTPSLNPSRNDEFSHFTLQVLNYILPDLSIFTRSEWLLYNDINIDLGSLVIQSIIYTVLLCVASQIDFYRKNL